MTGFEHVRQQRRIQRRGDPFVLPIPEGGGAAGDGPRQEQLSRSVSGGEAGDSGQSAAVDGRVAGSQ